MLHIGTSFNPEHWELADFAESQRLDGLRYCLQDLGMKHIRLSIRWSDVARPHGIDISRYLAYIQLVLADPEVKLTLNIGPIKTMRWPEETVPADFFAANKQIPRRGTVVYPESEIGKKALAYLRSLLQELERYIPGTCQRIHAFQLDNEPFNSFGQYGLVMSPAWVAATVELLQEFCPQPRILISSDGRRNLHKIVQTIGLVSAKNLNIQWTIGINYYYQTPLQWRLPIIRRWDNLTLTWPWSMPLAQLHALAHTHGWKIEVSEFQGEPWLPVTSPGNDFAQFIQRIQDCVQKILPTQEHKLIRYWGIEHLINAKIKMSLNEEQTKILEKIRNINENPAK